ncbi:MAG: manganese efflux pump [Bacteroidales bacterium]|nr:manganese efflux pump [Bacteroidales bacterium]
MDEIFSMLFLSVALSMDSFAVSVSNGLCIVGLKRPKAMYIATVLALFQGTMPILGWIFGSWFEKDVKHFDHWIAFILLSIIGSKMLFDGIKYQISDTKENHLKLSTLLTQAIATSIDAFAVGISLAILEVNIWHYSISIAVVTFLFAAVGLLLGKIMGDKIGQKAILLGGVVLIIIGIKILIEHLYFGL